MPPNEDGCFCRRCGYDLAGIGSGACPECGQAFDPADPTTFLRHPAQPSTSLRWLVAGLAITAIGPVSWGVFETGMPAYVIGYLGVLPTAIAIFGVTTGLRYRRRPTPRNIMLMAFVPAATFVLAITSLAIHMRVALGNWPGTIGNAGFPTALDIHAEIAWWIFGLLVIGTVWGLPLAALIVAAIRPAEFHVFFAAETQAAITALTGVNFNGGFIDKLHWGTLFTGWMPL